MKYFAFTLLCFLFVSTGIAQQPESNQTNSIPDNPTYFDFVKFYMAESPNDTAEGSFTAQIMKQHKLWGERLFPSGNAQLAGAAITNYAKNFNQNGIGNCTTGNWQSIGPIGVPSGILNARGSGQMHEIKFSPNYDNDGIIYACSNWGGLWRRLMGEIGNW